jgi:hypothetical protein
VKTEKVPYEVLTRFDSNGEYSGSHVIWRIVVKDDNGDIIAETAMPAASLDDAKADGFPIERVLPNAMSLLATKLQNAEQEREKFKQLCDAKDSEISNLRHEHEAALSEVRRIYRVEPQHAS